MGLLGKIFGNKPELKDKQKQKLKRLNRACGNPIHPNKELIRQYYEETKKLENRGFNVSPHNHISKLYYKVAFKK